MAVTKNSAIKYLIHQVASNDGAGNVVLQPIWPETIGSQIKPETSYRLLDQTSFTLGGTYDEPGGTLTGDATEGYTATIQQGTQSANITLTLPTASGTLATIDDVNAVVVSVGDGIFDLDNTSGTITVSPYDRTADTLASTWIDGNGGTFYLGTVNPTQTDRLNYNGTLYTKALFVDGSAVITSATYVDPTLENVLTQGNKTTLGFSVVDDIGTTTATYFEVTSAGAVTAAALASLDGGIDVNGANFSVSTAGAISTVSTLDVSGLSSLDGGINVNDDFTVDTDGNVVGVAATFSGLSSLDGGIDVNGSNFTVSSLGAVYAASTLEVDGATQLDGTLDVNSTSDFSGNVTLSAAADLIVKDAAGTPNTVFTVDGATGNVVTAGDLAVNGGDITTTATSATLFDSNAATINAFGDATTLNVGYDGTASSTTVIAGGITGTGNTKTVNIGTGADSDGTTAINIGASGAGVDTSTITIYGDLVVTGTTTTVNTTELTIADNIITLNSDFTDGGSGPTESAGFVVNRGGIETDATLQWDEGEDRWEINGNPLAVQSSGLNQFASTTSAELAGVLSDETGFSAGAKAVFSNNPSLAGLTSSGLASLDGGINVNDDFTVDVDGNVVGVAATFSGLSSLDGGIDVNGSNFTVSNTGAVYAASTLEVDGTTQLDGLVDINNSLTVDGSTISLDSTASSNFTVTGNSASLLSLSLDVVNNGTGNGNLNLSADDNISLNSDVGIDATTTTFDFNGSFDLDGPVIDIQGSSGSLPSQFRVVNADNGGDPELRIGASNTFAGGDGTATVTISASTDAASSGIGAINLEADEINIVGDTDIVGDLIADTFNALTLTAATTGFTIAGGTTSKTLTLSDNTTLATNSITLASTESITLQHASLVVGDASGTGAITIKSDDGNARSLTLNSDSIINSLTNGHVLYASANNTISSEAQLAVSRGGTGVSTATANQVFAAPNGSNGAPGFRSLVNADLPDSGVTAGTYTATTVNDKGVVTAGFQAIQVGYYTTNPTESTNVPSASLIAGGLFFEALEASGS